MSWKASGRVWDVEISHDRLLVLLAMADNANHDGGDIKPSVGTIAWKVNYSERHVRRIIRILEEDGILECHGVSEFGTMTYSINFDSIPKKKPYVKKVNGRPRNPQTKCPPVSPENPRTSEAKPPDILAKPPDILALTPGHSCVSQTVNSKLNSKKNSSGEAPANPDHHRFVDAWCLKYQERLGRPYRFQGGKDAKAVSQLLRIPGETCESLLALAERAWVFLDDKFKPAKNSGTIAGFNSRWQDIKNQIDPPQKVLPVGAAW